jgi:hypothetical protein
MGKEVTEEKKVILLEIIPNSKPMLYGKAYTTMNIGELEELGDFVISLDDESQVKLVTNLYNSIRNKIVKATVGKAFAAKLRRQIGD